MDDISLAMWDTYRSMTDFIKFSDAKAATLLASICVILSIVFSRIINDIDFIIEHILLSLLLMLGFVLGLISIYFCIICLDPRLKIGENDSLLFFRNIAKQFSTVDDYEIKVNNIFNDESQSKHQIITQVWVNSKIANEKFQSVNKAIYFFKWMIILLVISGLLALTLYFNTTLLTPEMVVQCKVIISHMITLRVQNA